MFFLRIVRPRSGVLDLVQVADETFRLLVEINGRKPAIGWLERQGCCPGAAAMLLDCEYSQVYNINSPAVAAG